MPVPAWWANESHTPYVTTDILWSHFLRQKVKQQFEKVQTQYLFQRPFMRPHNPITALTADAQIWHHGQPSLQGGAGVVSYGHLICNISSLLYVGKQ